MKDKSTDKPSPNDREDDRAGVSAAHRARNAHDRTEAKNDSKTKGNGVTHGSAYEEYLYGRQILSSGMFKPNWASTTRGRIAIRLVSRGIFGAAAFTIGGHYARRQLTGYEPWHKPQNGLQWVAKGFDTVLGKPIQWGAGLFAEKRWAEATVRFKPRRYFYDGPNMPIGRSLGAEMIAITFDFSSMSLGDALARNTIQAFDPNLPQPWFKDSKGHDTTRGHGHFVFGEWAKAVGRASWRSVTKNAGEDWFAALPYVYYMKWQRQALSKVFDGFKNQSDLNNNGGSLKINAQGEITGDYQLAGWLDLQGRFSIYNVFTLVYREMYDWIGNHIKKGWKEGIHIHLHASQHPITSTVDGVGAGLRYLAKSFIKANLFMIPSVPFFWVTRTAQSKWRSPLILDSAGADQNAIGTRTPMPRGQQVDPADPHSYIFPHDAEQAWVGKTLYGGNKPENVYFSEQAVPYPKSLREKGPYAWENCKTVNSKLLNPFGWACFQTGTGLTRLARPWIESAKYGSNSLLGRTFGASAQEREFMLRTYVDAAYSYTPYFAAKDEFGLRVNDSSAAGGLGNMDKAIYGFLDNIFTFRFKKASQSIGEIAGLYNIRSQAAHAEGSVAEEHLVEAKKHLPPSTRVQATTVQYNVPPPTHLTHPTATEVAKAGQDKTAAQKDTDNTQNWVDSVGNQKLPVTPPASPTLH